MNNMDVSQFASKIRNYEDHPHISDEDLALLWLERYPEHTKYLTPASLHSLNSRVEKQNVGTVPVSPLDGNGVASHDAPENQKVTSTVDRTQYDWNDSRKWTSYPGLDENENWLFSQIAGMYTHSLTGVKQATGMTKLPILDPEGPIAGMEPFKDIAGTREVSDIKDWSVLPSGLINGVVQTFHLLAKPATTETRSYKMLMYLNKQLRDPNVADGHKEYLRKYQIPVYEERLKIGREERLAKERGEKPKGLMGQVYDKMMPITEDVNTWHKERVEEIIANNPRYRRIQQWRQDDPIQTWGDYINPINYASGLAEMSNSMIVSFGPRKVISAFKGIEKVNKLLNGKKRLDQVESFFGNKWSIASLYLLENNEVQQETLGYLMNEFEWTDLNGDPQVGLPFEEAIGVAVMASSSYASVSAWLEHWQANRIASSLGIAKEARRSLLHNLVHKIYKELPKNRSGRLVYEGIDGMGRAFEEAYTEGWQAYMSTLAEEAIRQGYNIEDPDGFGEFISDMKVPLEELGWKSAILPGLSDNAQVKQGWQAGWFGGGGSASISTVRYGLGYNEETKLKAYEDANKNGDEIVVSDIGDGGVVLMNTTQETIDVIATGNELEQNDILTRFTNNANDGTNTVKVSGININSVDDYLEVLIKNISTTSGFTNQQIIESDKSFWENDKNLNPIQKLFKKHAYKNNNEEVDDWEKVADLMELTGDYNLLENKRKTVQDELTQDKIQSVAYNALEFIRNNASGKLKNKVIVGDKIDQARAEDLIDEFIADLGNLSDQEVVEAFAGGKLEEVFAGKINDNKDLSGKISFTNDAFSESVEDGDPRNLDVEELLLNQVQSQYEDQMKAKFDHTANDNYSISMDSERKRNPIISLDQKNASGIALEAHLGGILIDGVNGGIDYIKAVRDVLLGQESYDTKSIGIKPGVGINNTNLSRLLAQLGIKFNKKALQYADGKTKYIEAIVRKIDSRVLGSKVKIESQPTIDVDKIITPVSKVETAVDKEAAEVKPEKKTPVTKPEKKPTDKIEVTIMGETETMTRAEAENELRVAHTEIGPPSMRTEEDNETLEKIRGLEEALGKKPEKKSPAKQEIKVGNKITLYDPKGDAIEVEVTNVSDAGSFKYTYKGINREVLYDDGQYSLQNTKSPNYVLKGIGTDTPVSKMSDADLSDMKKLFQKKFDDTKDDKGRNVAKWQHLADLNAVTFEQKRRAQDKKASTELRASQIALADGTKDPLLYNAAEIVVENQAISASLLQRKLRIGHSRAKSLIDALEFVGIVSEDKGKKPRDVLLSKDLADHVDTHIDTVLADKKAPAKKPEEKKDRSQEPIFVEINGKTELHTRESAENMLEHLKSLPKDYDLMNPKEIKEKIEAYEKALGITQEAPAAPTEADPLPDFTKPISEQVQEGIITSSEIEGEVVDVDTIDLGDGLADGLAEDIDKICPE